MSGHAVAFGGFCADTISTLGGRFGRGLQGGGVVGGPKAISCIMVPRLLALFLLVVLPRLCSPASPLETRLPEDAVGVVRVRRAKESTLRLSVVAVCIELAISQSRFSFSELLLGRNSNLAKEYCGGVSGIIVALLSLIGIGASK